MFTGYEPFYGETDDELMMSNKRGDIDTTGTEWSTLSPDGQHFILNCLHYNPSVRLTPYQALHHPWIQTVYGMDILEGEYPPRTLKQKKSMNSIDPLSPPVLRRESSCALS